MTQPRNVYVVIWHNKEWLSWEWDARQDSNPPSRLPQVVSAKDLPSANGLWIEDDGDHVFGPEGEGEEKWDCLLPSFIQSEENGTVVLQTRKGKVNLKVFNRAIYEFWRFDSEGRLTSRGERPQVAMALPLGCATFMGVLLNQSQQPQIEAMLDKLHTFFLGQFEVRFSKATAVGLPRGLTAVKTLQLEGKASTYLVAKTPEMQLGKGHFGEVFRGLELKNENVFAVKILNEDPQAHWMEAVIQREKRNMQIMQLVKHKNIINFQDICDGGRILVMEYIHYGSAEQLYGGMRWPTFNLLQLTTQISLALDYIHINFGMSHRDVQPGNILVRRITPLQVVLADFGSASLKGDPYQWGHLYYRAPETYGSKDAHCMADIWSLGATILNLAIAPRFAFHVQGDHQKYSQNVLRRFSEAKGDIAPSLRSLLEGMLVREPNLRRDAYSCHLITKMLGEYPF